MASEGPLSPGTLASDGAHGSNAWSNPSNAASSNDTYASVATDGTSEYLKATNFGFAIPAGATINGIVVDIERKAAMAGVTDDRVRIVKGGTVQTEDKAAPGTWPTDDTVATYGDSSSLWGAAWTAGDINDSGFGVVLSVSVTSDQADVDHITITVHYTEEIPTDGHYLFSPSAAAAASVAARGGKVGVVSY